MQSKTPQLPQRSLHFDAPFFWYVPSEKSEKGKKEIEEIGEVKKGKKIKKVAESTRKRRWKMKKSPQSQCHFFLRSNSSILSLRQAQMEDPNINKYFFLFSFLLLLLFIISPI